MSASHVPVKEPRRLLGGPWTQLGSRALKWLGWSFVLLVAVIVEGSAVEAIVGGGHHSGLVYEVGSLIWDAGLLASFGFLIASGAAAVVAIARRGERAFVVYLSLVPFALLLMLFLHPLFIND